MDMRWVLSMFLVCDFQWLSAQEIFEYEGVKIPYDDIPLLVWDHLDSEQMRKEFQERKQKDPDNYSTIVDKPIIVDEWLEECDTVLHVNERHYGLIRIQSETAEELRLGFVKSNGEKFGVRRTSKLTVFVGLDVVQESTIPPDFWDGGFSKLYFVPGESALLLYEIMNVESYSLRLNWLHHQILPVRTPGKKKRL